MHGHVPAGYVVPAQGQAAVACDHDAAVDCRLKVVLHLGVVDDPVTVPDHYCIALFVAPVVHCPHNIMIGVMVRGSIHICPVRGGGGVKGAPEVEDPGIYAPENPVEGRVRGRGGRPIQFDIHPLPLRAQAGGRLGGAVRRQGYCHGLCHVNSGIDVCMARLVHGPYGMGCVVDRLPGIRTIVIAVVIGLNVFRYSEPSCISICTSGFVLGVCPVVVVPDPDIGPWHGGRNRVLDIHMQEPLHCQIG